MVATSLEPRDDRDVAIIGMACLFPGAPDLHTYWQNIVGKVSAIGDPPPGWAHDEWDGRPCEEPSRLYCRKGGFLRELACFDPLAYGVMPQSIDGAEPEHFLALRVAHEALADAGYLHRPFNRQRAGVILGRGTFVNRGNVTALQHTLIIEQTLRLLKQLHPEYRDEELQAIKAQLKASLPPFNAETAPGLVPNVMCGRIANRLDLQGPNYAVDAACASSLIAVDLGVQELLGGRCDLVVVGGVSVASPPMMFLGFCEVGALSRRQQIRPFDAEADGTLLGEGIGMVVLKRRADAERDGDRIYAVIKGVGVASDGRALAVLAPRLEGEELALRRAYAAAGIPPTTVELIEAHGTATPLGDVTEVQALRRVFGDREGRYPRCALGSVKSMISHTIPAAGVAGLIKTALALYHKILPPTLNCDTPNPKLELEKTPFYINTETRPWIHGARTPRRAGVNAFGFGGINAHVVLEETQGIDAQTAHSYQQAWETEVIILQGDTRAELIAHTQQLRRYLAAHPTVALKDLAYTLNTQLRRGTLRLSLVASSTEELAQKLVHALDRLADPARQRIKDKSGIYFFAEPLARAGKLAFLFPGEGPQYVNMLADLCLHFPEVRAHFDLADRVFLDNGRPYTPSQAIFPPPFQPPDEELLWRIDVAVASVFAANCALTTVLARLGISPDVIVGHSSGEYAALLAAGAVAVDGEEELIQHGLRLNRLDASFAERIPAAVLVAVGAVRPGVIQSVLETCPGPLYVTMDNCPHQVVLCGTQESAEAAVSALRSRGAICTLLPFQRGYHTPLFAPVAAELQSFFQAIPFVPPRVPIYSCATAQPFPADPEAIRQLAAAQWSRPVRFRETVEALYAAGVRLFVEVGPGGRLSGFVDDTLRGKSFLAVPLNLAHRSGITQLNHAIGLLAAHGVSLRLDYLYSRRQPRALALDQPAATIASQKPLMPLALHLPFASLVPGSLLRQASGQAAEGTLPSPHTAPRPVALYNGRTVSEHPAVLPSAAGQACPKVESQGMAEGHVTAAPSVHGSSLPMAEYFRTMERFLEVQQEVMQAFLAGSHAVAAAAPPQPTAPTSCHEPVAGEPQSPPGTSPPVSRGTVPPVPSSEPGEAIGSPARGPERLVARLLALVSERTGYPIEMLDLSLNMEADLGIDSIKRVEILGAFQQETGLTQPDEMEQATRLKTLQEVIDYFARRCVSPSARAAENRGPVVLEPLSVAGSDLPHAVLSAQQRPFIGQILSLTPGEEVVAACTLDLHDHPFLRDHVAIGRCVSAIDKNVTGMPVVPLTVSLEIMAEVAALVLPDKVLLGVRRVRVVQWCTLEAERKTLVCRAKRRRTAPQETVEVHIAEPSGQMDASADVKGIVVQAELVFGETYPPAEACDGFPLQDERPYRYPPECYYEDVMFHGPVFRGVLSIDRCGEDGVQGRLRSGAETGFFASLPQSACLLDPVLLDAAGQLVGFWVADRLERGFVFPTGCAALQLYGPLSAAAGPVVARARIFPPGNDRRIRADIECVDVTGRLLARLGGWEVTWFDFPPAFTRFNLSTRDTILSLPWPEAVAHLSGQVALHCCRVTRADLPAVLFDPAHPMWRRIWARLILNRREYERWQALNGPEKRKTEWLLGRLAAKDAVRRFLLARRNLRLCPADVEIDTDEHGVPFVRGPWTAALDSPLHLTLSHVDGMAVAIAGECQPDEGIGVDIEQVRDLPSEVQEAAFSAAERELLTRLDQASAREWLLRFWCAKEALGKALGRGIWGGPRNLLVQRFDRETGGVTLVAAGQSARELALPLESTFHVHTYCDGDYVVAAAWVQKAFVRHSSAGHRPAEDTSFSDATEQLGGLCRDG